MLKSFKRGFTLIELLVVIAIIGILASVVLVSLNSARSRGQDAAVQANLSSIRTQAELYYANNGNSYGATQSVAACPGSAANLFDDSTIGAALSAATNGTPGNAYCAVGASTYAVSAPLASGYWCVDSSGTAKHSSTTSLGGGSSAAACPN